MSDSAQSEVLTAIGNLRMVNSQETLKQLLVELLRAKFWMLSDERAIITSSKGEKYISVFTNEGAECISPALKLQMKEATFDDVVRIVEQANAMVQGIVIDPFGADFRLSKGKLFELVRLQKLGTIESAAFPQEGDEVIIGSPSNVPDEMLEQLKQYCSTHVNVNRVFLQLVFKEGWMSYLLVVDAEGEAQPLFSEIASLALEYGDKFLVDVIPYHSEMGLSVARHTAPFYEKKRKWIQLFRKK